MQPTLRGRLRKVFRHLRRRYGVPRVRAVQRVKTAPGVQAQHRWFEVRSQSGGNLERLSALVEVPSHSRARFVLANREATQLLGRRATWSSFGATGGSRRRQRQRSPENGERSRGARTPYRDAEAGGPAARLVKWMPIEGRAQRRDPSGNGEPAWSGVSKAEGLLGWPPDPGIEEEHEQFVNRFLEHENALEL